MAYKFLQQNLFFVFKNKFIQCLINVSEMFFIRLLVSNYLWNNLIPKFNSKVMGNTALLQTKTDLSIFSSAL